MIVQRLSQMQNDACKARRFFKRQADVELLCRYAGREEHGVNAATGQSQFRSVPMPLTTEQFFEWKGQPVRSCKMRLWKDKRDPPTELTLGWNLPSQRQVQLVDEQIGAFVEGRVVELRQQRNSSDNRAPRS